MARNYTLQDVLGALQGQISNLSQTQTTPVTQITTPVITTEVLTANDTMQVDVVALQTWRESTW